MLLRNNMIWKTGVSAYRIFANRLWYAAEAEEGRYVYIFAIADA